MNKKLNNYNFLEKFCFFLSTMSLFGLFYSLKLISLFLTNDKVSGMKKNVFEAINLGLGVSIFIIGLIITIFFILQKQDLSCNENENAFIFDITKLEDKTDNLFFSKISLFVLTGLSLPNSNAIISVILLILFLCIMGGLYMRKDFFSINPLVILFGYNIYSCIPENSSQNKLLLIKGTITEEKLYTVNTSFSTLFIKLGEK